MTELTRIDWPAVLTALGVLVAAVATAFVSIRNSLNAVKVAQDVTAVKVAQIDAAVNGKSEGEASIGTQVQELVDRPPQPAVLPLLKKVASDVTELKARPQLGQE